MTPDTIAPYLAFFTDHLYAIVFVAATIDATGLPFTGRLLVITAGATAGGGLEATRVMLLAAAGALVGDHSLSARTPRRRQGPVPLLPVDHGVVTLHRKGAGVLSTLRRRNDRHWPLRDRRASLRRSPGGVGRHLVLHVPLLRHDRRPALGRHVRAPGILSRRPSGQGPGSLWERRARDRPRARFGPPVTTTVVAAQASDVIA
jgi:hypothetical protein